MNDNILLSYYLDGNFEKSFSFMRATCAHFLYLSGEMLVYE